MGAKLQLTVETNFDQAAKDMKRFGSVSEDQRKKIDDSLGKIAGRSKTTLSGLKDQLETTAKGYRNAGQGAKALGAQSKLLERKIFALTKAGGDGTEAMKVLQKELKDVRGTMDKNAKRTKMLANAKKALATGALAVGVALLAAGAALIKNAFSVAKVADEYAKTARNIGVTAEELQEYNFIAERSGLASSKMGNALKKMNENVGAARTGQGELFSVLSRTNPKLLEQVKNAKDSGQAFDLLMGEMRGAADEADRAALAAAFFGRAGKEMGSIASLTAKEIEDMKKEVQDLGVITNDQAAQGEAFADSQHNMMTAIKGVTNELGTKLFPVITRVMNVIVKLLKRGGLLRTWFERMTKVITPVVMAIGKIGVSLFKLNAIIVDKVIGSIKALMGHLLKIPGAKKLFDAIGKQAKKFGEATATVFGAMGNGIDDMFEKTKFSAIEQLFAMEAIEEKKQGAIVATTAVIGEEEQKRLDEKAAAVAADKELERKKTQALATRLATEDQIMANSRQKATTEIIAFLKNNQLAEGASFEAKLEAMTAEKARILELDTLTAIERDAVETAFTERMKQLSAERAAATRAEMSQRVDTTQKFLGGMLGIIGAFSKKSAKAQRAVAIAQRGVDIATATVKGILATQAAFAAGGGVPGGIAPAIATGVQAGAAVASMVATPIPTAQTGASIVVPDNPGSSRTDNVAVQAGPGETIDVTARGEEAGGTLSAAVFLDSETLFSTITDGIQSGRIVITRDNIRAA